jgi:hypothetical protein
MYQIDNSTAVATIPSSTAPGTPGFFTDGNPATGVPATIMPAEYQNMLMMEVMNVLVAAGVTPSKTNFTQLLASIRAVNRQGVILADTGSAGTYTAANTPALTALPGTGYMQRVSIANLNPGASTYSPDGLTPKPIYGLGLQPLQGGELPVGIAVLMYLVQAGVNGGNGAWIVIESLGGAAQVAPASKSQHAVQLGQVAAVVGNLRSGRMSIATAAAAATFTADEVVVKSALGGSAWLLSSFSKTINLATTGAGGMDTGSGPVSGYVAIYAIFNPTTGVSALLAVNATSVAAPNIYGGANMPAGYTASALLTVVQTNASSQMKPVQVRDRRVYISPISAYTGSTGLSNTSISISAVVPLNAIAASGIMSVSSTAAGTISLDLFSDANSSGTCRNTASIAAAGICASSFYDLPLATAQTIIASASNSTGGTPTYGVIISGYNL